MSSLTVCITSKSLTVAHFHCAVVPKPSKVVPELFQPEFIHINKNNKLSL